MLRYYHYTQDWCWLKTSSHNAFSLYHITSPAFSDISTPSSLLWDGSTSFVSLFSFHWLFHVFKLLKSYYCFLFFLPLVLLNLILSGGFILFLKNTFHSIGIWSCGHYYKGLTCLHCGFRAWSSVDLTEIMLDTPKPQGCSLRRSHRNNQKKRKRKGLGNGASQHYYWSSTTS